ncbi:MAG: class I SAM-dependent methyltransferase [Actinobacteria bacterium]|nr:MAG: class I SAM-dependent methyltransferase [Actinomycetota bacterium]
MSAAAEQVIWHDLECGHYRADLPLWLELAAAAEGPVLDVGAGTGRVALELARAGHEVTALDNDAELLAALRKRAAGLPVRTVVGDARAFELGHSYALIVAAMQVIQLLDGRDGRSRFLGCARTHLRDGGLLACAVVEDIVPFESAEEAVLEPEVLRRRGRTFASHPVAVRRQGRQLVLERRRAVGAGRREDRATVHRIALDRVGASALEAEGAAHGLEPRPARVIAPTDDHVGSVVVMFGG